MFPDPRRRRPRFEFPGSTGAGPRQGGRKQMLQILVTDMTVMEDDRPPIFHVSVFVLQIPPQRCFLGTI